MRYEKRCYIIRNDYDILLQWPLNIMAGVSSIVYLAPLPRRVLAKNDRIEPGQAKKHSLYKIKQKNRSVPCHLLVTLPSNFGAQVGQKLRGSFKITLSGGFYQKLCQIRKTVEA